MIRKFKHFFTLICLLTTCGAWAQSFTITGTVTNEQYTPLKGVVVSVKDGAANTSTDAAGTFSIEVPQIGSVITFNYVGLSPQEVTVKDNGALYVTMMGKGNTLNDVVVIGYGTQKKSVVTGAISSVKAADLTDMPITRLEDALEGRVSGVVVSSSSGQPGSDATVRVRGTTSINSVAPLYVVDGTPVDGGIDYLNKSDIESIEVLKDAASAAIYGTRAAAGVILVTTKKGRAGSVRLTYNGYLGTQSTSKRLDLLDATQYATVKNEQSVADGGQILYANPSSLGKGTDWQNQIFTNARIQDHEFGLSGGSDISTFYASFGMYQQNGIVLPEISNYKRYNARLNSTHHIRKWFTVGENLGYSYIRSQGIGNTNSEFGGPLSSAVNLDPITPVVVTDPTVIASSPYTNPNIVLDPNGHPYGISTLVANEMSNPLAYQQAHLGNNGWSHNLVGDTYLEIEPIKGLKFRSDLGGKAAFYGSRSFNPDIYLNATTITTLNNLYSESDRTYSWSWENTASYTHAFGLNHFTGLVGTGAYVNNMLSQQGTTSYGLPVNSYKDATFDYANTTANLVAWGYDGIYDKLSSVFARALYDYDEKYLLTAIIRRDGSSRFGEDKKYGYFPSASAGWVMSKEDFLKNNKVLTFMKLRGGYGSTGSQNIGDFGYAATVSGGKNYTFGNEYLVGYAPNALENPYLHWEQTSQTDIGFDANLLHNITLTVDLYYKKTTGMLQQLAVPSYVGTGGPLDNIGTMANKGIDVELGYHKQIRKLVLDFKGNISFVKNNVISLANSGVPIIGSTLQGLNGEITRSEPGHAYNSFYGYVEEGIFQNQAQIDAYVDKNGNKIQPNAKPGDFKWDDINGDGVIDSKDRNYLGNSIPTMTFGFTVSASWNHFDLVAFAQGVSGNKIFNALRRLDLANANFTTEALNAWSGEGSTDEYPRLTAADPNHNYSNPSSFYLSSGAYFRLKTVQLGYTIPTSVIKPASIQRIRVYVAVNNLMTVTKYTGYDPEIGGSSFGIDRGVYPQARSYMAGLDLGF